MKIMSVSHDIVPLGQFKASLSKWLRSIQSSGHPLIITQNGKPAGVLLSPSEYDELIYRSAFLASLERGRADADSDLVFSTDEMKANLEKRRSPG